MTRRAWWLLALMLAGCTAAPHGPIALRIAMEPEPLRPVIITPDAEGPATPGRPSPAPSSSPDGWSSGTGGGAPPAPTPAPTPEPFATGAIALEPGFAIQRVAGDAAGGGTLGTDALSARFSAVAGLVRQPDGTLFVADPARHEIRQIPPIGPTRVAAGLGDGRSGYFGDNVPADATPLHTPMGLARDARTGAIFVADSGNGRIRLFTPGGRIYTFAGGGSDARDDVAAATGALLTQPYGLDTDAVGRLCFTERATGRLRRVETTGALKTLAKLSANQLGPVAASADGARLWVGEGESVRVVRPAGTPALDAAPVVSFPGARVSALAYDQAGTLYVVVTGATDFGTKGTRVLRLTVGADGRMLQGRTVETIAGTGGDSALPGDYSLPASPTPEATTRLLAGAWACQLAIDLTHAADPALPAGQLYLGNAFDDPVSGVRWGQVLKLTPPN